MDLGRSGCRLAVIYGFATRNPTRCKLSKRQDSLRETAQTRGKTGLQYRSGVKKWEIAVATTIIRQNVQHSCNINWLRGLTTLANARSPCYILLKCYLKHSLLISVCHWWRVYHFEHKLQIPSQSLDIAEDKFRPQLGRSSEKSTHTCVKRRGFENLYPWPFSNPRATNTLVSV